MRPTFDRVRVVAMLVILTLAGCSRGGSAGFNGPETDQSQGSPGPTEHRVMRLPVQLDPDHQPPPPAKADSTTAPSPSEKRGDERSKDAALDLANGLSALFHDAAKRVLPAVVTIRTIADANEESDEDYGDPLARLFGDDKVVRESLGSGVLIDASGIILTNYHVVRQEGQTVVQLHDGRRFEIATAKVDPHTDLAVVQLKNASGLPFAQLGDSDALKVGDWVLAVGNQLGLEATVTAGIISAKDRGLASSPGEDFLQTDAPINPGSSGGPLVNLRGEVVGINTAISSTTGGYQGIGFTIPITLAKRVSQQLIQNGKVRWAYLGVATHEITPEIAKHLGSNTTSGVIVLGVRRGSPAAKGGIRPGDVITKFDEKTVADPHQLQLALGSSSIGTQHALTVIREGKLRTVQVTIAELPPERTTERRASAENDTEAGETQTVIQ